MATMTSASGIRRITRDFPPCHYLFKVEPFSLFSKTLEKYESETFETAGHKWRLAFYPNGDSKSNGNGFISLYLVIDEETENLPPNWEVNVSFRLFVVDQIRNKYLTIEDADGAVKRFNWMKTEWGFAQLLSLDSFEDTSNGYLVGDSCIFGAEVFPMVRSYEWECFSLVKQTRNNTITFKMENFSKLDKQFYESPIYAIGGLKWKLIVYPRGCGENYKGKAISVFLRTDDLPSKRKAYVEYEMRIINQINKEEYTGKAWYSATNNSWGFSSFMLLKDLQNRSKDFPVNAILMVEVEITLISEVKRC